MSYDQNREDEKTESVADIVGVMILALLLVSAIMTVKSCHCGFRHVLSIAANKAERN